MIYVQPNSNNVAIQTDESLKNQTDEQSMSYRMDHMKKGSKATHGSRYPARLGEIRRHIMAQSDKPSEDRM